VLGQSTRRHGPVGAVLRGGPSTTVVRAQGSSCCSVAPSIQGSCSFSGDRTGTGSARVEQGWRGRLQAAAAPSATCTLCLFVCISGCDSGIGLARARA